jgi:hypothetical protein
MILMRQIGRLTLGGHKALISFVKNGLFAQPVSA